MITTSICWPSRTWSEPEEAPAPHCTLIAHNSSTCPEAIAETQPNNIYKFSAFVAWYAAAVFSWWFLTYILMEQILVTGLNISSVPVQLLHCEQRCCLSLNYEVYHKYVTVLHLVRPSSGLARPVLTAWNAAAQVPLLPTTSHHKVLERCDIWTNQHWNSLCRPTLKVASVSVSTEVTDWTWGHAETATWHFPPVFLKIGLVHISASAAFCWILWNCNKFYRSFNCLFFFFSLPVEAVDQ